MALTLETRKTVAKQMQPNPIEMPFVIRVAFASFNEGKNGRMKSSNTTNATEFNPLDKELKSSTKATQLTIQKISLFL